MARVKQELAEEAAKVAAEEVLVAELKAQGELTPELRREREEWRRWVAAEFDRADLAGGGEMLSIGEGVGGRGGRAGWVLFLFWGACQPSPTKRSHFFWGGKGRDCGWRSRVAGRGLGPLFGRWCRTGCSYGD